MQQNDSRAGSYTNREEQNSQRHLAERELFGSVISRRGGCSTRRRQRLCMVRAALATHVMAAVLPLVHAAVKTVRCPRPAF